MISLFLCEINLGKYKEE